MARTSCTATGCKSRKPSHKMYEVKRSRADPTVLGYACSRECVGKVLASDVGPVIEMPAPLRFTDAEPVTMARAMDATKAEA